RRARSEPAGRIHSPDRKGVARMIATLLRIGWTNLRRDRVAQALTFLLPIIFFSIFVSVFASQSDVATARIRIAVVDEDGSEFSRRLVAGLKKGKSLGVRDTIGEDGTGGVLARAAAEQFVKDGDLPVAVVLPKGLGQSLAEQGFGSSGGPSI